MDNFFAHLQDAFDDETDGTFNNLAPEAAATNDSEKEKIPKSKQEDEVKRAVDEKPAREIRTDTTEKLLKPGETGSRSPLQSSRQNETSQISYSDEKDAQAKAEKSRKYAEYKKTVHEHQKLLEDIADAETFLNASKNIIAKKNDAIDAIDRKHRSAVGARQSDLEEEKTQLAALQAELAKQNNPAAVNDRYFRYNPPAVNTEIVGLLQHAQAKGLFTSMQSQILSQPVQNMCGKDSAIPNDTQLQKLENNFIQSPVCEQLKTGVPSEGLVKKHVSKVSGIISAIMFFILVIAGSNSFMSGLVYFSVWVISFLIFGAIITYIAAMILKGIFSNMSDVAALIVGGIIGFLALGTTIASSIARSASNASSGSIPVRIIISVILCLILFGVLSAVGRTKFGVGLLQKSGRIRNLMAKEVFSENEHTPFFNIEMYCFLRHNEICAFFAEAFRRDQIREIESTIKTRQNNINDINYEMQKEKESYNQHRFRAVQDRESYLSSVKRNENVLSASRARLDASYSVITGWNDQPDLGDFDKWELDSSICVEHTADESDRNLKVVNGIANGVKVYYSNPDDSTGVMCEVAGRIISAFTKMNPRELMSFALINLNPGAQAMEMTFYFDWRKKKKAASGGVGQEYTGLVLPVDQIDALKEYVRDRLDRQRIQLQEFAFANREELKGAGTVTINELNALKQKQQGAKPFEYQIMILVPGISGLSEDFEYNRFILNEVMGNENTNGVIPVILIGKDREGKPRLNDKWKQRLEDKKFSRFRTVEML